MIDLSGTITPAQLVTELGVSAVTASKICKESGVGTKVGNSVLYDREAVKNVVRARHLNALVFLGLEPVREVEYVSPEGGYDEYDDHGAYDEPQAAYAH